jgi:hypothetical protein
MSAYNSSAGIVSGESGAVTGKMRLDADSVVLLLDTEGDICPDCYSRIVHDGLLSVTIAVKKHYPPL